MNAERIRFLADENFRFPIVQGIRRIQPQIDILTAREANILGLPDLQVIVHAATDHRILLTHDVRTMGTHFATFLASGQHSPRIFFVMHVRPIGDVITTIHLIWQASEPEEWIDRYEPLP